MGESLVTRGISRGAEKQGSGVQFIPAREILLCSGWLSIGQDNPTHNDNIKSGNEELRGGGAARDASQPFFVQPSAADLSTAE